MTLERDHDRTHAPATPTTADGDLAPGRSNRSNQLASPERPLVSALILRKARDANGVAEAADQSVATASTSTGHALPGTLMRKFESSLGADLSSVRVHTGSESHVAADAVGAKAYAVGNDIHFGAGHYDPTTHAGQHLIAHEVAHTVQQSGSVGRKPMFKLEVSQPSDGFETEADLAADAMVGGDAFSLTGVGVGVSRKTETETDADEGEKQMMSGAAKTDMVLQVTNATDTSDAQKALGTLESNQVMIEKGVAQISPYQKGISDNLQDKIKGKDSKLITQVPGEAIGVNAAVISDIKLYLAVAGSQHTATSSFQDQYRVLLADYGRVDGIASKYAGTSLKDAKDPHGLVDDAAGAGGHTTEELHQTYQQLQNDPKVAAAQASVAASTATLEKQPDLMSGNMKAWLGAQETYQTNLVTATVAQTGLHSLAARNAFQEAKAKADQAAKLGDAAKDVVMGAGKDAVKTAAKAAVEAGGATLTNIGAIAAEGIASGGEAAAMDLANKLVIDPAKDLLKQSLTAANAAVGIIDDKAQLDANIDAEQQKQDSATIQVAKTAAAGVKTSEATNVSAMEAWIKSALQFELAKDKVKKDFAAVQTAIKAAAGHAGKGDQGKALADMLGFVHEAEQFVVQANAVLDVATKGLGTGSSDKDEIPARARAALDKLRNRTVWMASPYPFKKADGETVTYYSAQEVNFKAVGPAMDASPEDIAGKGRADGFNNDPSANTQSSNKVIGDVVPQVTAMRDKVLAVRNALMADVFSK